MEITKSLSPAMLQAYQQMKEAFKSCRNLVVITAEDNNTLCELDIYPKENFIEGDLNCLIVCDNYLEEDFDEENQTLDGAYSIEEQDGNIIAIWLPYPEPIIEGVDNIIKHISTIMEIESSSIG